MSGYAYCIGSCINCRIPLTFNPERVPSIRVNGSREPLCRECFNRWNDIHRTSKGLAPEVLHPAAYEPCPEEELSDGCD